MSLQTVGDGGRAGGNVPAGPGGEQAKVALRAESRRRRNDPTAIGMPLGAAFVGLLLAQGHGGGAVIAPAAGSDSIGAGGGLVDRSLAALRGQGTAAPAGHDGDATQGAVVAVLDPSDAPPADHSGVITGSDPGPTLIGDAGSDQLRSSETPQGPGGQAINVTLGSTPSTEIPPVVVDASDRSGEGLGPIGHYVQGGSGNDTIIGTENDDTIKGGAGNDTIDGRGGNDNLDGEAGNDTILGGAGNDVIQGGSGNDYVDGQSGNDIVDGGTGSDVVLGGSGNDLVSGGAGDDVVDGGTGTDIATGDGGNDRIFIGSVRDFAIENSEGFDHGGVDTVSIRDSYAASLKAELGNLSPDGLATFVLGDKVGVALPAGFNPFVQQIHPAIENIDLLGTVGQDVVGGGGSNRITGNAGDNMLDGRGGDDWIDGAGGRDLIFGGDGADRLYGGEGADQLHGGAGNDQLFGGNGDDLVDGGAGADLLYGGGGNDTYVFGLSEAKPDRVFDFDGHNRLDLSASDDVQAIVSGPDLYIQVGGKDIAIIDQYLSHQDNWDGIVTKSGLKGISQLITDGHVTTDPTLPTPSPDLIGSEGNDILRAPSDAGHHLRGLGGDDQLFGAAGNDRLDGGKGTDTLQGGAGNDTYVLRHGDSGIDRIVDHQGSSTIEVQGIDFKDLSAWKVGGDLWLAVDTTPLGTVEDWQSNHHDWSVRVGDKTVAADDLFS